jgi:hypothetical protein
MFHNTTGSYNTAIGRSALRYNPSGSWNSALGVCALFNNRNVATSIGNLVGGSGYTDGTYSGIFLTPAPATSLGGYGFYADVVVSGGTVTSVTLVASQYVNVGEKYTSTAIGAGGTGFTIDVTAVNSGEYNTGVGAIALNNNTLGKYNTGVGYSSGNSLSSGDCNSFLGVSAGNGITTGSLNVAFGAQSLFATNAMSCATAIGYRSL